MANQFTFSIAAMKSHTGTDKHDSSYVGWFVEQCLSRLRFNAAALRQIADGSEPLAANSLTTSLARRAEVRFAADALEECEKWFESKPAIAALFTEAIQESGEEVKQAEFDFQAISRWFS